MGREGNFRLGLLIGVLAAAVVGLVIALVVSNGSSTTTVTEATSVTASSTTATTSTTNAATTSTTTSSTPVAFRSPSGNIVCKATSDSAVCAITDFSYQTPSPPASCADSQGWGHIIGVQGSASGNFVCADNQPAEPSSPTLAYGRAILVGRIACISSPKGVRCANRSTRHGFQIAREQVQLF
jgi:hypothetical protein